MIEFWNSDAERHCKRHGVRSHSVAILRGEKKLAALRILLGKKKLAECYVISTAFLVL